MNKTALTMPADDEQVESVLCGVVTDRIADVTALGSVQVHSDRRVPGDGLPRRLEYRVDPAHLTGQFLLEVNRLIPARHCGLYRQSNHMTGAVRSAVTESAEPSHATSTRRNGPADVAGSLERLLSAERLTVVSFFSSV